MVINQSSAEEGGPWEGVQRKPSELLDILYLDHFAQDDNYICKNLLRSVFKISALSLLGMLYLK